MLNLKVTLADIFVNRNCINTKTPPPAITIDQNTGIVNVNDKNEDSNLYPIILPTIANNVIKVQTNIITSAVKKAALLKQISGSILPGLKMNRLAM